MKDVPSERRKKKQMNETTAVVASSYCKSLEQPHPRSIGIMRCKSAKSSIVINNMKSG